MTFRVIDIFQQRIVCVRYLPLMTSGVRYLPLMTSGVRDVPLMTSGVKYHFVLPVQQAASFEWLNSSHLKHKFWEFFKNSRNKCGDAIQIQGMKK